MLQKQAQFHCRFLKGNYRRYGQFRNISLKLQVPLKDLSSQAIIQRKTESIFWTLSLLNCSENVVVSLQIYENQVKSPLCA